MKTTLKNNETLEIKMPNGNIIEVASNEDGDMSFVNIDTDRRKANKDKSQSTSISASERGLCTMYVHTNEDKDTFKVTKETHNITRRLSNGSFKSSEVKVGEFGTSINILSASK